MKMLSSVTAAQPLTDGGAEIGQQGDFKQTDLAPLPQDWNLVRLGDICEFQNGVNADAKAYGKGIPFANVLEIINNSFLDPSRIPGRVEIPKAVISAFRVLRGDILFNRTSETLDEVGLTAVYVDDTPVVFGGFVVRGRPQPGTFDSTYLGYALRSRLVRMQIASKGQGAVRANISQAELRKVRVPCPPQDEQAAIASALRHADDFIESLQQLIEKKRLIKLGAMQELLSGRRRLPGFTGEWAKRKFAEIAALRKRRINPTTAGRQPFCVELEHVSQGTGRLEGSSEAGKDASLKAVFEEGDVLFGKLRAYLRKYWLADRPGVCSTEFWVLIPSDGAATSTYLHQLVQTDEFIEMASQGYGTHMPRSDWSSVAQIEFPVPTLEEQEAIGQVLAEMDAELDALETRLEKARQIKQGMMQELLTGRVRLV